MARSYVKSYVDNKARLTWGMGYHAVLQARLGAKFRDLHAKDSSLFRKRLIHKGHNRIICFNVCLG